jgi:hypothetical protein
MKRYIALAFLVMSAMGCTQYHSLAAGPSADKVYLTKTTSFIIWATNKAQLCDVSGTTVTNCTDINLND